MKKMLLMSLAAVSLAGSIATAGDININIGGKGGPSFHGPGWGPNRPMTFPELEGTNNYALARYYDGARVNHRVTTSQNLSKGHRRGYESVLGFVLEKPEFDRRGRELTQALYECEVTRMVDGNVDHMVSLDPNCERSINPNLRIRNIGLIGYSSRFGNVDGWRRMVPIRRCYTWDGKSHFVSRDYACEGQSPEHELGFIYER